jgi:dTDP-4-amino-4,6-dideoxygalactose transaminase
MPVRRPLAAEGRGHVWHLYVIVHSQRDHLRGKLAAADIQTGLHYPTPLHLQPAYAHLKHRAGDFPVSEWVARECLSLPLFPEMTEEQQDAVVAALKEVVCDG